MRFPSSKVRKKNEITMEINKKSEEKITPIFQIQP